MTFFFNTSVFNFFQKQNGRVRFLLFLTLQSLLLLGLLWPGIMQNAAMQWDATEIYLPWKFFITEQMKLGFWPMWNAYVSGGFPQHGDPGTWYEVSWLIGLLGTYDLQSLLFEYGLHLLIAGAGVYFILIRFHFSWILASALGMAFSLNGFFIGNAQHLGWLVGMAWTPWLLFFSYLLFKKLINAKFSLMYAAALATVAHFQFTGGYLGITAVGLYLLILLNLTLLFYYRNQISRTFIFKWLLHLLLAFVLFVCASSHALLGLYEFQYLITRATQLRLAEFQFGSWPLGAWKTMGFEASSQTLADALKSDVSLINVHWGQPAAWLVVLSLFGGVWYRKRFWFGCFLGLFLLGSFFFAISMGAQTPLHEHLIRRLAVLNLFRFPAMYRGFGMFFYLMSFAVILYQINRSFRLLAVFLSCLLVVDVFYYAVSNRWNTVFAKIPAHQVNSVLKRAAQLSHLSQHYRGQIPLSLAVDKDSNCNASIPFMNQNQGVYLQLWATDGYNPYQLKMKANTQESAVQMGHFGVLRLDSNGDMLKGEFPGGVGFRQTAESIEMKNIKPTSGLKTIVILQTPLSSWKLFSNGEEKAWGNYQNRGIQFEAVDNFTLKYQQPYFAVALFLWVIGWMLIGCLLIISQLRIKA